MVVWSTDMWSVLGEVRVLWWFGQLICGQCWVRYGCYGGMVN